MRCALLPLLGLFACSSSDGGLSAEQSQQLFARANAELHELHQLYFAMDPLPEGRYTHECLAGGRIYMDVQSENGQITTLLHSFDSCNLDGSQYSGSVDYLNIVSGLCGGDGFGIDIVGELSLVGDIDGDCLIDAYEECGVFTGSSCGHSVE
jgi:hypothetical protein